MSSEDTRVALMEAAVRLTARGGTKALTARGIATEAGVNEASVRYHFDGVAGLLNSAYERATSQMLGAYIADLTSVDTFEELYAVGVRMAHEASGNGNAAVLSHLIAGAYTDEAMARMLRDTMTRWNDAVSATIRHILRSRGLEGALDADALTASLTASTIGMMTMGSVPGQPLGDPMAAVRGLPPMLDRAMRVVPAPIARLIFGGARS